MRDGREKLFGFEVWPARTHARIPVVLMALNSHTLARARVPGRRLICLLLSLIFLAPYSISAGPAAAKSAPRRSSSFQTRMARIVKGRIPRQSFLGVLIVDAATGQPLYQLNPDTLFHPASTTKLFTTALALSTLGPGFQFQTTLESSASLDAAGRLAGDLVLVGRGDPSFSNRRFPYDKELLRDGPPERPLAELADAAISRGLKEVTGGIVGDDSWLPYERYPVGWAIEDMKYAYGAPVSALAFNDNTITVIVTPAAELHLPATLAIEPAVDFYALSSGVLTAPRNGHQQFKLGWEPGSLRLQVRGAIPLGAEPDPLVLANPEPAEFSAALLKRLLESRGVRVLGQSRALHAPDHEPPLSVSYASRTSPLLSELVRTMNKASENLYAELLLRSASRLHSGDGSLEAALAFEKEFLESAGVPADSFDLYDGSGLSRNGLSSPRAQVALLLYAQRQTWFQSLLVSLPIAGEDGTLFDRMKNTPAAGRIQAKTGSLDHARALAGYATTVSGRRLIFSILLNNQKAPPHDVTGLLDSICIAMVESFSAKPSKKSSGRRRCSRGY